MPEMGGGEGGVGGSPTRLEGMETKEQGTGVKADPCLRPALRGWKLSVFGIGVGLGKVSDPP